jgi:hypothetical protein
MQYKITPRKVTLGENRLLVRRLSRKAAAEFAEQMKVAGKDVAEAERIGLKVIADNVTFEDGSQLDLDEVPADDVVQLLKLVVSGEAKSVADFTSTP